LSTLPQGESRALNDGLPTPQRYWAALTILLGIGICVLDAAMINVALPQIALTLSVSAAQSVWLVNAYGLAVAMTLLPLASMAERHGFKRVFAAGLTIFMLGALASALAPNFWVLLIARIAQALGASAIMCLFGGLMRHIYPTHALARGISVNAMTVAVTSVIGPTLGSLILTIADWRWIFLAVIPLGAILAWSLKYLPDVPKVNRRFDQMAAALAALTIAAFITALNAMAANTGLAVVLFVVTVFLAIPLVRRSLRQEAPLLPLDLLRITTIRSAVLASFSSFGAQMATFVSLPFYLMVTLERDALSVGLLMAGWPLGAAVMALIASYLTERYPVAVLCAIGAAAMALGTTALALLPLLGFSGQSDSALFGAMVLAGVGFGFFQTPNNRALLGAAPKARASAIGGVQALTRVLGQTVGGAIVATVFILSLEHGPRLGLMVGTVFALLALVINVRRHLASQRMGQLT
jgi:DHA2 family multidrug resistance protein-like MFS transporter